MKKRSFFLVLALLALLAYGCSANRPSVKAPLQPEIVELDGTMVKIELEGGFWAIKADDGATYVSTKELPPMLQQQGLRVHFRGRLATEEASFKMHGKMIHIEKIKELPQKSAPSKAFPTE